MTDMDALMAAADALADAAAELEKQAKRAGSLGAVTGSHWTHLGLAQMKVASRLTAYRAAREAVTRGTPPAFATSA